MLGDDALLLEGRENAALIRTDACVWPQIDICDCIFASGLNYLLPPLFGKYHSLSLSLWLYRSPLGIKRGEKRKKGPLFPGLNE